MLYLLIIVQYNKNVLSISLDVNNYQINLISILSASMEFLNTAREKWIMWVE